ncbi:D-alanyl-D-alanine carboxypeptidase DacC [Rubritalea halochordaticola]
MGVVTAVAAFSQPILAKESYVVVERHSGKVLLADNSEVKRPVASLTKIATSKVVLDWAQATNTNLSTMITVPSTINLVGGANPMSLQPGDQMTLRDALYSTLMGSDNKAALTLADHVGRELLMKRQLQGDPVGAFVVEMNKLAKSLGMTRTKFATPHGLVANPRDSYSTASDIARLSMHVMKDTAFGFYVKQTSREISVTRAATASESKVTVENTNKMLGGELKIKGIKTGTSQAAGQCIAICAERQPFVQKHEDGGATVTPVEMVVVILGSADREGQGKRLITQGWQMYDGWRSVGYPATADRREFILLPGGNS